MMIFWNIQHEQEQKKNVLNNNGTIKNSNYNKKIWEGELSTFFPLVWELEKHDETCEKVLKQKGVMFKRSNKYSILRYKIWWKNKKENFSIFLKKIWFFYILKLMKRNKTYIIK